MNANSVGTGSCPGCHGTIELYHGPVIAVSGGARNWLCEHAQVIKQSAIIVEYFCVFPHIILIF